MIKKRNVFDIADMIIERAYPNIYKKEKGWWGAKRIPNFGILRGAIAKALSDNRGDKDFGKKHRE